jgi:hypothetical protein
MFNPQRKIIFKEVQLIWQCETFCSALEREDQNNFEKKHRRKFHQGALIPKSQREVKNFKTYTIKKRSKLWVFSAVKKENTQMSKFVQNAR